jgi:hypothetical protein
MTSIGIQTAQKIEAKVKTYPGGSQHPPFFTFELVVTDDKGGKTEITLFTNKRPDELIAGFGLEDRDSKVVHNETPAVVLAAIN